MLITKNCEQCGKEFITQKLSTREHKYCSSECYHASTRTDRACVVCGKIYRPHTPRQLYCSTKCHQHTRKSPGGKCAYCGKSISGRHNAKYCNRECHSLDRKLNASIEIVPKRKYKARITRSKHPKKRNTVTITCIQCGIDFEVYPSAEKNGRKFCSRKCTVEYSVGENAHHWKGAKFTKTCKYCGKTFMANSYKPGIYCSKECTNKDKRSIRTCAYCGKAYETPKSQEENIKYCSRDCFYAANKPGKGHFNYNRVETTCQVCGKVFEAQPCLVRDGKKKYCSRLCGLKGVSESLRKHPNQLEKLVADELDSRDIIYQSQFVIGRWIVDFVIPDFKIAIEADGVYWHSLPKVKSRDKRKNRELRNLGYSVFRFSEDQIRKNVSPCVDQVLSLIYP